MFVIKKFERKANRWSVAWGYIPNDKREGRHWNERLDQLLMWFTCSTLAKVNHFSSLTRTFVISIFFYSIPYFLETEIYP